MIGGVAPGSPAWADGIQPGWIVASLDNIQLTALTASERQAIVANPPSQIDYIEVVPPGSSGGGRGTEGVDPATGTYGSGGSYTYAFTSWTYPPGADWGPPLLGLAILLSVGG